MLVLSITNKHASLSHRRTLRILDASTVYENASYLYGLFFIVVVYTLAHEYSSI